MERRQFLIGSSLALLGLQSGFLSGCFSQAPDPQSVAVDSGEAVKAIARIAQDLQGIGYVGPHCISALGVSGDESVTRQLLTRIQRHSTGSIAEAIRTAIAEDFRAGDILDIEQWQLSLTECMLAALAALQQGLSVPTAYQAEAREPLFCKVSRWGPRSTKAGVVFQEQPDGSAAFWVSTDCAPTSARLILGSTPLPTYVREDVVTARVPHYAELEVGVHELTIFDPKTGESMLIGEFVVE